MHLLQKKRNIPQLLVQNGQAVTRKLLSQTHLLPVLLLEDRNLQQSINGRKHMSIKLEKLTIHRGLIGMEILVGIHMAVKVGQSLDKVAKNILLQILELLIMIFQ